MNARGCYCDALPAESVARRDLPAGFCGACDRCGRPGHIRHHPGAVPFTGAWCDYHYRWLSVLHPLAPVGTLLWLALSAGVVAAIYLVVRG